MSTDRVGSEAANSLTFTRSDMRCLGYRGWKAVCLIHPGWMRVPELPVKHGEAGW